ncbi:type I restriction enzyme, R subunit [Xylanibacter ruminicola]|uniref:type I site-specific deoxyribonuclease n=1 Tax=Xylanibacter ruminicola TaxID=839 RepID=A0A1M7CSX0_XYLRU|nr:DEAD/DEAH box helicase family protein [Xylanibacter ruminicola]SHL70326.1 type I restriction enzyme, R subunit [Xylanibacter ruminicola]
MSEFSEDSRVKFPALIHLVGMGFEYVSSNNSAKPQDQQEPFDPQTNILVDKFKKAFLNLNPELTEEDAEKKLADIQTSVSYKDLGRYFYNEILMEPGVGRIVDFSSEEAFKKNNTFQVTTEMTCGDKKSDNFRPDITLFINGLPLAFIEVKPDNNHEGIQAEANRMKVRFQNPKFRSYINITQMMMFSNDMEYDTDNVVPTQGAFYATTGLTNTKYNLFREEGQDSFNIPQVVTQIPQEKIDYILADNNKHAFRSTEWFNRLLETLGPTKRMINSLFTFERFYFFLKYGIAYVDEPNGLQKHIMRYPQVFAAKAIEQRLEEGIDRGVIWHTQGSGKTALSYYCVKFLTDYYSKKGISPQFFFIVDRLDLLQQAHLEFKKRGLRVRIAEDKDDFKKIISSNLTTQNTKGEREITVVNIQKFSSDARATSKNDYNLENKRIYFIDEAHRDYSADGCFLKNLMASDRNAIKIALTGTPIISREFNTKDIFGEYIHTYFYNSSIADGYTLRLMREKIASNFKIRMQEILEQIKVKENSVKPDIVYSHESFVQPLLDYIMNDLKSFRTKGKDYRNVGGMMICSSSAQAKLMFQLFLANYADPQEREYKTDEQGVGYWASVPPTTIDAKVGPCAKGCYRAALILDKEGTKDSREKWINLYKQGKIDLLIVFQMLQTGFDAPRLKKLYLNRQAKDHNLLQTLTRVNRPYLSLPYGHVVDFANIEAEYNKTNAQYQKELEEETGDSSETYTKLFVSVEEAVKRVKDANNVLKEYDVNNLDIFARQVNLISDKKELHTIEHALENVRDLENMLVAQGTETEDLVTIKEIKNLLKIVTRRLDWVNFEQSTNEQESLQQMLNEQLENISFSFYKEGEGELVLQQQFKETVRSTRQQLSQCIDPEDPQFVSLLDEFKRVLKKKDMEEQEFNMAERVANLNDILKRVSILNEKDRILSLQYHNDLKFARIHKRLEQREQQESTTPNPYGWSKNKQKLNAVLLSIKEKTDDCYMHNEDLTSNAEYFTRKIVTFISQTFDVEQIGSTRPVRQYIGEVINREYQNERRAM